MFRCITCKKLKPKTEFYRKKKVAGGKNYRSSSCKQCDIARVHVQHKNTRAKIIEFGGGKCKKCGYSKCIAALEFHHRNKSRKEFRINAVRSLTAKVKRELDKCDLLCANCHREEHNPIKG